MSWAFTVFYLTVPFTLFALIGCFVDALYTLDTHTRAQEADVVKFGITYFLVVAAFPIPFILVNWLVRMVGKQERRGEVKEERDQYPTMAGNVTRSALVVIVAAFVLVIGQIYRTGSGWAKPAPSLDPAWWDSKACFYVFEFVPEILVVILYAVVRVDRLFFVPGGSDGETGKISTITPESHENGEDGHGRKNIISRMWHATFVSRLFGR
jgi:heme/copper-type cytochrome/quinol oxidase subunit 2